MFPEWHHAVPESAYFKVPETLKTFRMYSTSRYAPCATRLHIGTLRTRSRNNNYHSSTMTGVQFLNVMAGYVFVNDNLAMAVNTTFFM